VLGGKVRVLSQSVGNTLNLDQAVELAQKHPLFLVECKQTADKYQAFLVINLTMLPKKGFMVGKKRREVLCNINAGTVMTFIKGRLSFFDPLLYRADQPVIIIVFNETYVQRIDAIRETVNDIFSALEIKVR
jgi:hypothetical protein